MKEITPLPGRQFLLTMAFMLSVLCLRAQCPEVTDAGSSVPALCDGQTVDLFVDTTDPVAANIYWTGPDGDAFPAGQQQFTINVAVNVSSDPKCVQILEYGYEVLCAEDGQLISSGSIPVTVYADVHAELVQEGACMAVVSQQCEEFFASWEADIDNDGTIDDAGIGFSYTAPEDQVGEVIFAVSQTTPGALGECGDVEYFIVPFDCSIECPNLLYASSDGQDVCDGDLVNFVSALDTENADPFSLAEIQWSFLGETEILSTDFNFSMELNSTTCTDLVIVHYEVYCAGNGDFITLGNIPIYVHPIITSTVEQTECGVSFSQDCPDFTSFWQDSEGNVGLSFDYEAMEGAVGTITNTIENPEAPPSLDCYGQEFSTSYNCSADCPVVISPAAGAQHFCSLDASDLSDAATGLAYSSPAAGSNLSVIYTLDSAGDQPFTSGSISASDDCTVVEQELYCFLQCDLNGDGFDGGADDTWIAAGNLMLYVYPEIQASINVQDCSANVDQNCDYEISFILDSSGTLTEGTGQAIDILPGEQGSIVVTVSDTNENRPEGCSTLEMTASLTCPDIVCPMTNDDPSEQILCDGESPTPVAVNLIDDNSEPVQWFRDNSDPTNPSDLFDWNAAMLHDASSCEASTTILHAYTRCDTDANGSYEWIDLALMHSIKVYPELQFSEQSSACTVIVNTDCDYTLSFSAVSDGANDGLQSSEPIIFNENETGSIIIEVTANDADHPTACAIFEVSLDLACPACIPPIDPLIDDHSYCEGAPIPGIELPETGDVYIWSSDAQLSDTLQIGTTFSAPSAGTYFVQAFSALDNCPSENVLSFALVEEPLQTANFDLEQSYCQGLGMASPELLGSTGGEFSASNGLVIDPVSGSFDLALAEAGTYTITYANQGSCGETINQEISIAANPQLEIALPESVCLGEVFEIEVITSASNDALATWFVEGAEISAGSLEEWQGLALSYDSAGTYNLRLVIEDAACVEEVEAEVLVSDLDLSVTAAATIFVGEMTSLESTVISDSPVSYQWWPDTGLNCSDCPNPTAAPSESTTYMLTVENEQGCQRSEEIAIIVDQPRLNIPNAFSPNGDGINDVFRFISNNESQGEWAVYDRWGKQLFSTRDLDQSWDGSFQGEQLPMGVYVYYGQIILPNGEQREARGNVTLLR